MTLSGSSDVEVVATRLARLAQRRRAQQAAADSLASEIRQAVRDAQMVMPIAEIARRLELDRSTLYRTYMNGTGR